MHRAAFSPAGLSPRVRGNLDRVDSHVSHRRPIPAGAGEPSCPATPLSMKEAYPRGCGGTEFVEVLDVAAAGLSPRVRGNPSRWSPRRLNNRPIPAGAGEPSEHGNAFGACGAYPRGCGGTIANQQKKTNSQGLSPWVRGNPWVASCVGLCLRPIPAGAGEPSFRDVFGQCFQAYPRGCGGTAPQHHLGPR